MKKRLNICFLMFSLVLYNVVAENAYSTTPVEKSIFSRSSKVSAKEKEEDRIKIDSIRIRRNWRTKDNIIIQELEFRAGDIVTTVQIDRAISKIWNIGNFSKVSYEIDTLKDKRILLIITAHDAVTIMPDLSVKGNRKEYLITAGINDNNFLGRNIDLGLAGSFGTNARYANIRFGIPRQLLYRNMTIRTGFLYGGSQRIKYQKEEPLTGVAYMQNNFHFSIGNPWHTDYKYTFSPDLSIGFFHHKTDSSLLTLDIQPENDYSVQYLTISVSETIGLMNRIRHQEDGYIIYISSGLGIGMGYESPGYLSAGFGAGYAKLLNRYVQLNVNYSTGYTTAELPTLINYLGPDNVKGIITGERWGKSIWSANASAQLTYINRDWFAIEHTLFANAGNADDVYWHLYTDMPLFSAGTSLRFMIPAVPWLGISFHYAYRGDSRHWYSMDF